MEFVIDEAGCRQLSATMVSDLEELLNIILEIENQSVTLRAALGDDYESIARRIRVMKDELRDASREIHTVIQDMNEYLAQVKQARFVMEN